MYNVILNKDVLKSIDKIPENYIIKIKKGINDLSMIPRPPGCCKLVGFENYYRIRVGIYRIIYSIEDEILTIKIIKIDHRSSVYK